MIVELIGSIYDAVIDPTQWGRTLDQIRTAFGFQIAIIAVSRLPDGEPVVQVAANVPDEYAANVAKYSAEIVELWGGLDIAARLPLDEPLLQTDYSSPADWERNRFYLEWAKPQGITNQLAVFLARDRTMIGSLGLGRHESAPPIGETEIDGVRLIAPHIRRAVTITRLLDGARGQTSNFEAALDATSAGMVLVESDMSIVHANDVAERMLRDLNPIRGVGGRLELISELVPGQLAVAVEHAVEEASLGRRGISIPARRRDGSPPLIQVLPLRQRSGRLALGARSVAAVFIAPSAEEPRLPVDAMAVLFDLTPAETRVFELITAGRSKSQMARDLGIAESTVKTHTLRLFDKTGRHSREAILRLAHEIGSPL